ncbi:DUF4031 domain-containing protein [Streptomyces sp. SPB162]|uniref:DUF4031 domain-containing protein n=1 Tax=Streptomyces sp. SPB162 TaxID=2940560 RepID=UPI002406E16C|nr:DUF4031 domain-containing protein [Streptomyces sp. SPB162]MDF9817228.1 hypothetical protein [Streptomyces sp. SPB162]
MAVYVDEITDYGAIARMAGLRTTLWAHLTADTREELHTFAAGIGLKRSWFQHSGDHRWHYDITPGKRAAALRAGAQPIDRRGLAALMARRRTAEPNH